MNLYRRNEKTPLAGIFAVTFTLAVLLFAVDFTTGGGVREQVRAVGGAGLSVAASAASAVENSGFFTTRRSLEMENESLRRELSLAAELLASAPRLESENESLRAIARLAGSAPGQTARVISSFRTTPYGTFMIDLGRDDGIGEGFLVLTEGGYVLGEVTDVLAREATVRTVFAPGVAVDLVTGNTAFSAEGRGGGNARAEIPREAVVAVGDSVRAPLFANRAAGVIGSIEGASSSATQTLHIRVPANLDSMQFVYVIER